MITVLCSAGVAYACFCRLLFMSKATTWTIRWSYAALGTAAAGMVLAPFVPEWQFQPHPVVTALLLAQLATMAAMSKKWQRLFRGK